MPELRSPLLASNDAEYIHAELTFALLKQLGDLVAGLLPRQQRKMATAKAMAILGS